MKPTRLDELRDIIIGPDNRRLDELRTRIEDVEQRSADVAEVLPESVAASVHKDTRLVSALRAPVRQCVSESVRDDPESYANALFPIMGPAIRRAVREAFRAWIDQANRVIEQGLSLRGLSWRVQAWRAGIPYGEYVLQQTLVYRVDHVYLIHAHTGLLVAHAQQGDAAAKDDDAIAAMLTAIQDFVSDSFEQDSPQRLRTAELGELSLWAVHGPTCTIVAVVRGVPPAALRGELAAALERIEAAHGESLRDYAGDGDVATELEPMLRPCLLVSLREPGSQTSSRRLPVIGLLLSVVLLALAAWFVYGLWLDRQVERVAAALEAAPGIVLADVRRSGRLLLVRGLRDPLAASAESVVTDAGWQHRFDASFTPFISLERELVLMRAELALSPPPTVSLEVDQGTLTVSGSARAAWLDHARRESEGLLGVDSMDASGLEVQPAPDSAALRLARIRERLDPPPTVGLALNDDALALSGHAPLGWIESVPNRLAGIEGIGSVDAGALVPAERVRMAALEEAVAGSRMVFPVDGATLDAAGRASAEELGRQVLEYTQQARVLSLRPRVLVIGHSDESGSRAYNLRIERERAAVLAAELRAAGVDPAAITAVSQLGEGLGGERRPGATLSLSALPETASPPGAD